MSGRERVSELPWCISTLRQLQTRAALCYPGKEGETSQLSAGGTGRGWQIVQLIHEMQSRGNASQTGLDLEGVGWERGPEMKGVIVVHGFPQTLWSLWE